MKVAEAPCGDLCGHHAIRAAAQVHGSGGQRLVHGHQEIAGTQNAALRAQRLLDRLAKRDAHVFHGVVLVHIEIAAGFQLEVKRSMSGNQVHHVIEEADSRSDARLSAPIQIEFQPDIGFVRLAVNCRSASHV